MKSNSVQFFWRHSEVTDSMHVLESNFLFCGPKLDLRQYNINLIYTPYLSTPVAIIVWWQGNFIQGN